MSQKLNSDRVAIGKRAIWAIWAILAIPAIPAIRAIPEDPAFI